MKGTSASSASNAKPPKGTNGLALIPVTMRSAPMAWMRDANYAGNVEKSMKWLCEACKAGRFGSTQSTILSLRAIVTYDKLRARPKAPGTIQVIVDGKPMGSPERTTLSPPATVPYEKPRPPPRARGTIQVIVDGKPMGSPVKFDEKSQ